MYAEVHANRVFYNNSPQPGHTYRQLTIVEGTNNFEFRRYEGDVIRSEPEFRAASTDAAIHFHPDRESALVELEEETTQAYRDGFIPHDPIT